MHYDTSDLDDVDAAFLGLSVDENLSPVDPCSRGTKQWGFENSKLETDIGIQRPSPDGPLGNRPRSEEITSFCR